MHARGGGGWWRCLMLVICVGCALGAGRAEETKTAEVSPEPVTLEWDHKIPLRDGVRLSAMVFRPLRQPEKLPCVVAFSCYPVDSLVSAGVRFARQGYVFVAVNARGRADSEGVFEFAKGIGEDGYDIVEHAARLPWSDGRVVMWGASWLAYAQWMTAEKKPPSLRAIAPMAPARWGGHNRLTGLVGLRHRIRGLQWLAMVSGRADNVMLSLETSFWDAADREHLRSGRPFAEFDETVGFRSPVWDAWMRHEPGEAYFRELEPTPEEFEQMDVPALTIVGYYDTLQSGAFWYAAEHARRATPAAAEASRVVTGPFTHEAVGQPTATVEGLDVGPAVAVDMDRLVREWFDHLLKGGPLPERLRAKFSYFVVGENRWAGADSLAAATAAPVRWLLDVGSGAPHRVDRAGRLVAEGSGPAGEVTIVSDPRASPFQLAEGEGRLVSQRLETAGDESIAVFQSEPLTEDQRFIGAPALELWLRSDVPDADVIFELKEVKPDGAATMITWGGARLRYRDGVERPALLPVGEPVKATLDYAYFAAYRLRAGSRLRLVVMTGPKYEWERNLNTGGANAFEDLARARVGHLELLCGPEHASALRLPLQPVKRD